MSEAQRLHGHLIGQQGSRRSLNTPALVLDLENGVAVETYTDGGNATRVEYSVGPDMPVP